MLLAPLSELHLKITKCLRDDIHQGNRIDTVTRLVLRWLISIANPTNNAKCRSQTLRAIWRNLITRLQWNKLLGLSAQYHSGLMKRLNQPPSNHSSETFNVILPLQELLHNSMWETVTERVRERSLLSYPARTLPFSQNALLFQLTCML